MPKTRLYVECPKCRMQYLVKDFALTYSNGAYIEDVPDSPEWQLLFCPCQPRELQKLKLKEKARLYLIRENEGEQTHFSLKAVKRTTASAAVS